MFDVASNVCEAYTVYMYTNELLI